MDNMEQILTSLQAFNATIDFLDEYYKKTKSDDAAVLLGGMHFLRDGETADPAAWADWIDVVGSTQHFSATEAFNAMIQYTQEFAERVSSEDLIPFLKRINTPSKERQEALHFWHICIDNILQGQHDPRRYLTFVEK